MHEALRTYARNTLRLGPGPYDTTQWPSYSSGSSSYSPDIAFTDMLPRLLVFAFLSAHPLPPLRGGTISGARPRSARLRLDAVYPLFLPVLARARIHRAYPRVGPTILSGTLRPSSSAQTSHYASLVGYQQMHRYHVRALAEKEETYRADVCGT
jgi:hypothetical protein